LTGVDHGEAERTLDGVKLPDEPIVLARIIENSLVLVTSLNSCAMALEAHSQPVSQNQLGGEFWAKAIQRHRP
jgi:hypothetical protein